MRLIDADALLEDVRSLGFGWDEYEQGKEDVVECIECAPTIDPVKYGWWKYHGDCGVTECSVCGWKIEEYVCDDFKYCPSCGAYMTIEDF